MSKMFHVSSHRQTDVITPLRRSTRLSNRYTRLNFQRSTLGQYGDDSYSIGSTSVLDESGQSVPFDFDYEDDIVRHDHSYSKGIHLIVDHTTLLCLNCMVTNKCSMLPLLFE